MSDTNKDCEPVSDQAKKKLEEAKHREEILGNPMDGTKDGAGADNDPSGGTGGEGGGE